MEFRLHVLKLGLGRLKGVVGHKITLSRSVVLVAPGRVVGTGVAALAALAALAVLVAVHGFSLIQGSDTMQGV